uniref:Fucosyltransferase n=1 Tax=Caenorhabditis tropicalis TaxID=1561998 RepID=A0A1I7TAJ5_9PELO
MWALENPFFSGIEEYKDYFNWTMGYRRDSDVFMPYGALIKSHETINYTEIWKSKKKEVVWLVSNNIEIKNQRKEVVEKLKELGMQVDLFGKVYGNEPDGCSRYGDDDGCEEKFYSPYKFTISFENSNCQDYVTEKFWKKAGRYKTVPIVMERKIYRDLEIPDSMYIAIDDFPSLQEFVDYLKKCRRMRRSI